MQTSLPFADHKDENADGKCDVCGYSEECEHSWDEGVITSQPTCTEQGVKTFTCLVCGDVQTETVDAEGHSYQTVVTDPTCTDQGYTTHTCHCGDSYETDRIDALGHTEETVIGSAATCTEAGLTDGKKCFVCEEVLVAQETIAALGHTYDDAFDEICNVCNYVRDVACTHTETVIISGVAATCTTTGLTEGTKCKNCEEIITAQETIAALGHTEETVLGSAATCTETGLTDGKKCSVCEKVLVAQEAIEALGHSYSEATCTKKATCSVCGDETGELAGHIDANEDGKCDACEYQMTTSEETTPVVPEETTPVVPEETTPVVPEETTPETPEEKPEQGLSGGAIAGIVAGSTVVVGGGGFAVWWFVIQKRTTVDIGNGIKVIVRKFRRK